MCYSSPLLDADDGGMCYSSSRCHFGGRVVADAEDHVFEYCGAGLKRVLQSPSCRQCLLQGACFDASVDSCCVRSKRARLAPPTRLCANCCSAVASIPGEYFNICVACGFGAEEVGVHCTC